MSASIKTLADGFNNEVYPKTKTAAVYDDNDNLLDTILSAKQNSTDSNLNTTAKTVVGAINEVDSDLGSPSSASAVTGADAFSKISSLNSDIATLTQNAFGSFIDISSYNTSSNLYTFGSDGYVYLGAKSETDRVTMSLYGSSGNAIENRINGISGSTWHEISIYVRKGMKCYFALVGTDTIARFYPFTS